MKTNVFGIARFSTVLLLSLTPGCGSGDSGAGTGASGAPGTTGGSGAVGTSGGPGASSGGSSGATASSGGTSPGTGGTNPAPGRGGGPNSGTGGANPGTGGANPGNAGMPSGMGGASNAGNGSGAGNAGMTGAAGATAGFTLNVELSTAIATVGIATWSLDAAIDSATIHFGRDAANFEYEAPVDLAAADHRTLLLGMKQNTSYYAQVTATGGGKTYTSEVATVKTGALPSGLPTQTISDKNASALFAKGGFTLACTGYSGIGVGGIGGGAPGGGGGSSSKVAFIFDGDGDVVWAYDLTPTASSACTSAHTSIDGKSVWVGNFGNTTADGAVSRIPYDGLSKADDFALPGRSHDFTILPNDHVLYFARDNGSADQSPESIFELDPATGMKTKIYSENTDFGDLFAAGTGSMTGGMTNQGGHTNQINYVPELNAISFSMYFLNTIALISYPEGKLLATFGGDKSTFPNMTWEGEHGHDVHADHIDIFNNNGTGGATVLRFQYDLQAKTATKQTDYSAKISSPILGDVKEQPNGNYFVTYTTSKIMQELDPSLTLLRQITSSGTIGYVEHRGSMYGKPPPFNR